MTVGTVFESAHIPLPKMLQAVYLMTSSKKGVSADQLHRILGVTYKTAWFAMRSGELAPMGGRGGIVEADEPFIGQELGKPKKRACHHKMKVLSLVDRTTGQARSVVVDDLKPATVVPIVEENIAKEARVVTDEAGHYHHLRDSFVDHSLVKHGQEEYVRPTIRPSLPIPLKASSGLQPASAWRCRSASVGKRALSEAKARVTGWELLVELRGRSVG